MARGGYTDTPAEPAARPRRTRRAAAARGAHRVITVLAVLGSLHALFLLGVETWRFFTERQAVAGLESQVQDLKDETKGLKQVAAHAGDQRYREDLARRQGYMYPNELRAVTQQPLPGMSLGNVAGNAGSGSGGGGGNNAGANNTGGSGSASGSGSGSSSGH